MDYVSYQDTAEDNTIITDEKFGLRVQRVSLHEQPKLNVTVSHKAKYRYTCMFFMKYGD